MRWHNAAHYSAYPVRTGKQQESCRKQLAGLLWRKGPLSPAPWVVQHESSQTSMLAKFFHHLAASSCIQDGLLLLLRILRPTADVDFRWMASCKITEISLAYSAAAPTITTTTTTASGIQILDISKLICVYLNNSRQINVSKFLFYLSDCQ